VLGFHCPKLALTKRHWLLLLITDFISVILIHYNPFLIIVNWEMLVFLVTENHSVAIATSAGYNHSRNSSHKKAEQQHPRVITPLILA
jgi:hypothetical protein